MTGSKNITFCFEDFYPSNVPYCHILKDIIEECSHQGHQVSVITSSKQDMEEKNLMLQFFSNNAIKSKCINAIKSKKLNSIWFSFRVFFYLLFHGKGTLVIPSTPPVIMAFSVFLARYLGGLRFDYIYHCQDIHPEALVISKNIQSKLILKILSSLDKLNVKFAKKNIVLSEDMKNTLLQRYTKFPSNICIHNNFIPSAYLNKKKSADSKKSIRDNHSKSDIIFVFAGNLGAFQNLEMLLESFLRLRPYHNAYLYFIGDGKLKEKLKSDLNSTESEMKGNIIFLNSMKSDEVTQYISKANYGVVSLSANLLQVAFPSKISTYLNIGLPLLLCGGKGSQVDKEIIKENLGISIDGSSVEKIKTGLITAINQNEFFNEKHQHISNYFTNNYDRKKLISNLVEEITR
jgi:glycosyltransferase involved in cell wall biosynthesis